MKATTAMNDPPGAVTADNRLDELPNRL